MMQPGEQINGKYRLVRMIGDGGMGSVFEATHEVLGTPVALKFLHPELASKPNVASRFLREARVSATIRSPYVTRVTDVDTTRDGIPFLVMELLTGESLQAYMERRGRTPAADAVGIMAQVLLGIEAAHACGVIHRDLKPENIFICESDKGYEIKLLDFGVAKVKETSSVVLDEKGLTRPGSLMGTPEYMAPEQMFTAERVDHRADVYSAGVILYEMISGRRPVDGDSPQQIISVVAAGRVTALTQLVGDVAKELAEVVHRAMDANAERRFESAAAMRAALARFSEGVSLAGRQALDAPASSVSPALIKHAASPVGAAPLEATARSAEDRPKQTASLPRQDSSEPVARGADSPIVPVATAAAPAFQLGVPPEQGAVGTAAIAVAQRQELSPRYGSDPGQQPMVPPPQPVGPRYQAPTAGGTPWQQAQVYGQPGMPPTPYGTPGGPHYSYPTVRGGRNPATRWLVAGLIAFGAGLIVTLVLLIQGAPRSDDDMPPMPQLIDTPTEPPAPVTIAPQGLIPESTTTPLPMPSEPAGADAGVASTTSTATPPAKPPKKDAGSDAGNTTVIIVPTPWPFPTAIPTTLPLPQWPPPKPK